MSEQSISITRFIDQLDACFNRNNMKGARDCIRFWEEEARRLDDERGLLTVLNEAVGYYRRVKKKTRALEAMEESVALVEKLGLDKTLSGSTVFINSATTLAFFGQKEEALGLYRRAQECFAAQDATSTYEYATLLNNRAGTLHELKRYDEAEADYRAAVDILKEIGGHDGELAISLVMLAHVTFDRDHTAYDTVEPLLDEAWEAINADDIVRDGNYAYCLRKCAPSFDYFKRPIEAQAMRDVAKEIYSGD